MIDFEHRLLDCIAEQLQHCMMRFARGLEQAGSRTAVLTAPMPDNIADDSMPRLFPVPQAHAAENDQRSPGDQKVTCDRPRHQLPIHPVKARSGGDDIENSVGPVNLLRSGLDEPDIRRAPARGLALRMRQHVWIGVDRDNRGEMRQQSKEHLTRPAAQIKEALSPIEPALGYHPVHEFLRVRNTEVRVE